MSGFVAVMNSKITTKEQEFVKNGLVAISHRGPDQTDIFTDDHVMLGFCQSDSADLKQERPYTTVDRQFTCLFNGELYNHDLLRAELVAAGVNFTTQSKTETISQLYQKYGVDFAKKLQGMFAITLYDHSKKRLIAARDSFGIKPLYYKLDDNCLALASELKVFRPSAGYKQIALNFDALSQYFTFQYAPEDATVINGIFHVPAGFVLTYDFTAGLNINRFTPFRMIKDAQTATKTAHDVQNTIIKAVQSHLQTDIEVGTFLSGGIDSTIVAAVAKKINPNIKAFTIGYDLESHSEISDAQKSADALGIDLQIRKVSAREYMNAVRKSIYHMDSPQADPSAIMFYLLSEFAAREVKACLSGEGADELFGGYPIYQEVDGLKLITKIPKQLKPVLLTASKLMPTGMKGKSYLERGTIPLHARYAGNAFIFNEVEKTKLLKFTGSPWRAVTDPIYDKIKHLTPLAQMQTIDLHTWLKGDIFLKADRLSMAHTLEVRAPFLDESVYDVAAKLTKAQKIDGHTAKAILREAFDEYLPDHMKKMKKRGFPVPLSAWMRTELYEEIHAILNSPIAASFINQEVSLSMLAAHRAGQDHSRKIWTIMIFILWLEAYLDYN